VGGGLLDIPSACVGVDDAESAAAGAVEVVRPDGPLEAVALLDQLDQEPVVVKLPPAAIDRPGSLACSSTEMPSCPMNVIGSSGRSYSCARGHGDPAGRSGRPPSFDAPRAAT
jgi:hypothetical protein